MNKALIIIAIIVIAGAAFFGGMKYQQSKTTSVTNQTADGQNGQRRFPGRRGAGNMTIGQIVSADDKSITIKLPDGSSKFVTISGSTTISKTDTGSKTDLTNGTRVATFGTTNSDGSITAQNIQINPMFRNGPGGQGTQRAPSPSQ